MPIKIKPGESEQEFISRCIGEEISSGKEQDVSAAICYSYWRRDKMSSIKNTSDKVMAKIKFDSDFRGINLLAEEGDDPCQNGYKQLGTKILDGREVPACIPEEDHPDNK
jgi:hypothetical protein